jgi:plastocyanin
VTSRRIRLAAAGVAVVAAPASVLPLAADARNHRTHRPPPNVKLWRSMAVNETEWAVRPGHLNFAAGTVRIHVYNVGMDDHDLTVADAAGRIVGSRGVVAKIGSKAGETVFTVRLKPGRYRVYCSLFAGTADSHEAFGMKATIRAY